MAVNRRPIESWREGFARDGFVLLERWIAPRERETIRSDIDRLLLAPHGPSCSRPHNVLLPLRWSDATVQRLLASERRVQAIRNAVGASDLRWISGYVSVKEANSGPLWWHQDWWCWDHPVSFRRPAPQVAVLCYLTGTDREHGALRLLPGSHLRSSAIHAALAAGQSAADDLVDSGHPALSDHPEQLTLRAVAGDAVVIDYRLLHGTHANSSDLRRDCVILNFAPSWRDLPAPDQSFCPPQAGGGDAVVAVLGDQPSPTVRRDSPRPSPQPVCAGRVRDGRVTGTWAVREPSNPPLQRAALRAAAERLYR